MHFSDIAPANSAKTTKIATVVVLHAILGYGLMESMSKVDYSKPKERPFVLVPTFQPPPPPKVEPEPPQVKQKVTPKTPVVPKPEVIPDMPVEDAIVAEVVENPVPQDPAPAVAADPGPAQPAANPGQGMRTAVLPAGCAVPDYPTSALRNGEEGTVVLALLVNATGAVDSSRVTKSSGSRALDKAAQGALSMCKFQPAMANGQPEAGWAQISYVWKLDT